MDDHKLSPSASAETLRSELPLGLANTPPQLGVNGWSSPFTGGQSTTPGSIEFDFGTPESGIAANGSGSAASKWSATTHKLSKHNLAAFGAKLQSTAAHATSKYKNGKVGGPVAAIDMKDDNTSLSSTGPLLKSKMFRQSKTDLKALSKIKAPSTMADRSPTITRSSRELDRIAGIGTTSINNSSHLHHHFDGEKKYHHPHISFLKRDSPTAVLSSSSSNSKLASEGTIYSFHPAPAPPAAGNGSSISLHSFKTADEMNAFIANSWSIFCTKLQPIFRKEVPRIPVEDVNILLSLHFGAHVSSGATANDMLERVNDLLFNGLSGLSITSAEGNLIKSLTDSWLYFYTTLLPNLEAIFLPLQLEIEGFGQVLSDKQAANDYWKELRSIRLSARRSAASQRPPSLRQMILVAYRDAVVMPILPQLSMIVGDTGYDATNPTIMESASQILQCINVLALIHSSDANQTSIDSLLTGLSSSWISRPRLGKDRRGLLIR